ncbi:MAG TPA: hypothetical protein VM097_00965 [Mycobacteriales bacterium]|nr:hypothetical protein [Mycobacteriales bacterium]
MRIALVGAAALTTALAGVAAAVPVHTADFALGGVTWRGETALTSLAAYGPRGTDVLTYRHGATGSLTVTVRNTGRFPATVTSLDLGAERLALLSVPSPRRGVELAPGQGRTFTVGVVLGNCRYYHEREVATYDHLRVRFSVIGGTGSRDVRLTRPIVVHSPMIVGCPDRKLDRTRDNRTSP